MLSPDGLEWSQALGCFDVTNHTDNGHWRCFQNGHSLHNLLLVHLGTRLVHFTNDMGHASLVGEESAQMDWLGLVILGEGLCLTTMALGTLLGRKGHGPMARGRKLTMRLEKGEKKILKNSNKNVALRAYVSRRRITTREHVS